MKEKKEGVVKEKGVVAGHLEAEVKPKRKMKMWVLAEAKGMRVSTKTLEIREEGEEDVDKDQEEKASVVPVFITMKVIMPLNALNDREGQIGELIVKKGFPMWMRMHSHHI